MAVTHPELAPARPVVHLAPPKAWMNDPNGLSHIDGVWHAYYQHNPDDDVWGPMYWRHATSPDLLRWTDHGIALAPTQLGDIYSGSIVADHTNSAGFGPGARVAIFTLAGDDGQRQGIAHSADGHSWTMYQGNPVLVDTEQPDFRDPKVIRQGDHWLMALAVGQEIRLYRSDDLRRWELAGRHVPGLPIVDTVECPDLVPIRTRAGESGWIMTYCDGRGGPGGRSVTFAVAGNFDGSTFTEWARPEPLDHGPDFYAAQSFHGADDAGDPVVLGWMSNWPYANDHPSSGRRGVLSLPRSLSVESRARPTVCVRNTIPTDQAFPELLGTAPTIPPGRAVAMTGVDFEVLLRPKAGIVDEDVVSVRVTVDGNRVKLERSGLGLDALASTDEIPTDGEEVTVVVDHGTIEVLAAGRTMSALYFAGPDPILDFDGSATARSCSE